MFPFRLAAITAGLKSIGGTLHWAMILRPRGQHIRSTISSNLVLSIRASSTPDPTACCPADSGNDGPAYRFLPSAGGDEGRGIHPALRLKNLT